MISYQLQIYLKKNIKLQVGKLGFFQFPKGHYIYTGSARKNMESRIKRHISKEKNLHWHIDHFLKNKFTIITKVYKSHLKECNLNNKVEGIIVAKGFGNSDCKSTCISHLKLIS